MIPPPPSQWIGILIDGRLFDLPEQESEAQSALRAKGIRVFFASELDEKSRTAATERLSN